MVLADLGRRITKALHTLSNATVINEDVSFDFKNYIKLFNFIDNFVLFYQSANFLINN